MVKIFSNSLLGVFISSLFDSDSYGNDLETTAEYADVHGDAASRAQDISDDSTVHRPSERQLISSHIDDCEGSCLQFTGETEVGFLVTDVLRELPSLRAFAETRVATSPLVLRAIVKRGDIGTRDVVTE